MGGTITVKSSFGITPSMKQSIKIIYKKNTEYHSIASVTSKESLAGQKYFIPFMSKIPSLPIFTGPRPGTCIKVCFAMFVNMQEVTLKPITINLELT